MLCTHTPEKIKYNAVDVHRQMACVEWNVGFGSLASRTCFCVHMWILHIIKMECALRDASKHTLLHGGAIVYKRLTQ